MERGPDLSAQLVVLQRSSVAEFHGGDFGRALALARDGLDRAEKDATLAADEEGSSLYRALLLAKSGLLRERRATTHWAALNLLADVDSTVTVDPNQRVVEDGVVTSAGVAAGIDMALTIVERFCGREVADETAHYIEYPRMSSAQ